MKLTKKESKILVDFIFTYIESSDFRKHFNKFLKEVLEHWILSVTEEEKEKK